MVPLFMVIFAGFIGALVAPTLAVRLRGVIGWVLALLPAALAVYFLSLMPQAAADTPLAASYPWVPDLGLALSLRADGLNLLFALLVSGIGTLLVCYAGGYLKGHAHLGVLYAWLLTFMAALFRGGMLFVFVAVALGVSMLTLFSMMKVWNEAFWKTPAGHEALLAQPAIQNAKARYALWLISIGFLAAVTIGMGLGTGSIFALANLISLTPGTLTLDVSADRRVLFLHAMYASDADLLRRELKEGMERRLLEVTRGAIPARRRES